MADKKENELSELERFEKTVKKGIEIFKDYECVIERVKKAKEAYAKITQIANKMEQINQLQSAAINRVLMIRQPLMGKYNGQVVIATTGTSLWAKAQNELNLAMKANIIGIVVSGLGVLISTLGACQLATNNMADSTGELSEKQKDIIKNSQQTIEDIKQEAQARKERVVASGDEFNTTQALWGELQKCVDANGKIRTGYEERAQYVRGELANTLGIEIDIVNGQIKNYGTLNKSVQDVIASKKIEAMLDTMEPEYNKAKREKSRLVAEMAEEYNNLTKIKKQVSEANVNLNAEEGKFVEHTTRAGNIVKLHTKDYYKYKKEVEELSLELEIQEGKYAAVSAKVEDNTRIMDQHGLALEAAMTQDTIIINNAINRIESGINMSVEASSNAAREQAREYSNTLLELCLAQENGMKNISQTTIDEAAESMGIVLETMEGSADNMGKLLVDIGSDNAVKMIMAFQNADLAGNLSDEARSGMEAMIAVMASMDGALSEEGRKSLESFMSGFDGLDEKTQETWSQVWYGALEGLEGFEQLADPAKVGADTFLTSLREALVVKSPSGAVRDIFAYVWPGAEEGLTIGKEGPLAKAGAFVLEFLGRFTGSGLFASISGIGSSAMQWFGSGVLSQSENAKQSGTSVANSAKSGVESVSAHSSGYNFGSGFGSGIGNAGDSVVKAAKKLGGRALSALKERLGINSPSKEAAKLGRFTSSGFLKGIKEQIPEVKKASEDLATAALQGMDVQSHLSKMRSAMSMEKSLIGANLTSRVVHEFVMGSQNDLVNIGEKIEALQNHMDNMKIQLQLEGKAYIDKREAGYILAPEINKRLGEFAELRGRGNNSR